jgi:hypothetical protein
LPVSLPLSCDHHVTPLLTMTPVGGGGGLRLLLRRTLNVVFSAKHLYLTNTVSCGMLLAAGDLIEQRLERAMGMAENNDAKRTGERARWFFLV